MTKIVTRDGTNLNQCQRFRRLVRHGAFVAPPTQTVPRIARSGLLASGVGVFKKGFVPLRGLGGDLGWPRSGNAKEVAQPGIPKGRGNRQGPQCAQTALCAQISQGGAGKGVEQAS